ILVDLQVRDLPGRDAVAECYRLEVAVPITTNAIQIAEPDAIGRIGGDADGLARVNSLRYLQTFPANPTVDSDEPNVLVGVFGHRNDNSERLPVHLYRRKFPVRVDRHVLIGTDPYSAGAVFIHGRDVAARNAIVLGELRHDAVLEQIQRTFVADEHRSI